MKQRFDGQLQRPGQIRDAAQCNVAGAPFDVGDVGAMHVGAPRQFLLRDAQVQSVFSDHFTDPALER